MGADAPPFAGPAPSGRPARALLIAAGLVVCGCTPTVRVDVAPITINAKLDADVRLRLDQEVKDLVQKNPNLF